jgi:hypothetical protein
MNRQFPGRDFHPLATRAFVAHLHIGVPGYNFLVEKRNFYYDVCFKSKKFQIAQIFNLSFRSLKNQERAKFCLMIVILFFLERAYRLMISHTPTLFF